MRPQKRCYCKEWSLHPAPESSPHSNKDPTQTSNNTYKFKNNKVGLSRSEGNSLGECKMASDTFFTSITFDSMGEPSQQGMSAPQVELGRN